jgi:hypothetical protein
MWESIREASSHCSILAESEAPPAWLKGFPMRRKNTSETMVLTVAQGALALARQASAPSGR